MKGLKTNRYRKRLGRWFVASALSGAALVAGGGWFVSAASPTARFERARAYLRANSPEGVQYEILSLNHGSRNDSRAALLLAWLRLREKPAAKDKLANQKAALADLTVAMEDIECRPLALALMGRIFYEQERLAEAVTLLQRALSEDPQEVEAHRWLGIASYDIGNTATAADHLQRVAELEPANGLPHRLIGLMLKEQGHYAAAAAAYEKSLGRDPSQPGAGQVYYEIAQCQFSQRNYDGALEALEQFPETVDALVLRAECYHAQARAKLSNECVDRALAQDPQAPEALALKGRLCSEAGKEEEAAVWLSRAIDRQPNNYQFHYQLQQAYRRLGEEALADVEARRMEELRRMTDELNELLQEAEYNADAELRYRIVELASRLDMPELAQNWAKAARLVERVVPAHRGARP